MKRACAIETQNPSALIALWIGGLEADLLDDSTGPGVIRGQHVRQRGRVVAGPRFHGTSVRSVPSCTPK